jgi:hypothetical protein
MGHHYKVFNKSKDDAEEKKKKMENPAALGSTHLRDKIFLFFPFYFYKFFEIRNQPFTPKQVRSKKRKKKRAFLNVQQKVSLPPGSYFHVSLQLLLLLFTIFFPFCSFHSSLIVVFFGTL